jgi:hypothetical protein
MMHNKGLQEDDIQKLHKTATEPLTDQELLLSTISSLDLSRKHSGGWTKSGKHKREAVVCSTKDDDITVMLNSFLEERGHVLKNL